MGGEVSRVTVQQSSFGARRKKINIDSFYAEEYKRASLDDISFSLLRMVRDFGRHRMAISSPEFQQVFKGVLTDPGEHFALFDARGKGVVDILEIFSAAFLYSAAVPTSIDSKIDKIFALFDFDGSQSMNEVEAEIMIESLVRGASRVAMIPLPEDLIDGAGKFSASLFYFAKQPLRTGEVTARDVKQWASEREDVSAYLSRFTEARMIISSLELVERSIEQGISMLMQAAGRDEAGNVTVDRAKAGDILRSLASVRQQRGQRKENAVLEADVEAVVGMLAENLGHGPGHGHGSAGQAGHVPVKAFKEVLRCWVAFSVVDDEGLGSVTVDDLKALLWIGGSTAGEEPPEASVQKIMNEIDESQDGVVERMEWIRYSVVLDEETGNVGFDGECLQKFRRYDDDRSGTITADEMGMMVRDSVAEAMAEVPDALSLKPGMDTIVETMVQDIAKDLVAVMGGAGSGLVGWTEFKKNQNLVATRLGTLREFVLSAGLQHRGAGDSKAQPRGASDTRSEDGNR